MSNEDESQTGGLTITDGTGTIYTATDGVGATDVSGMTTVFGGYVPAIYGPGLTTEETKELNKLKEEREKSKKQAKLAKLKTYPADIREKLVEMLRLKEMIEEINGTEAEKTAREIELENKNNSLNFMLSNTYTFSYNGFQIPPLEDLSHEDIAKAHAEQILEEEISK